MNSIHSFSQSPLGGWFLGFIALMTAFTITLIYLRRPLLRAKTKLESLVSREATFLYNNLLLVALCLTILWGVMYPLLTEAVRGETRSVSKPYYDFFLHVFGLPLLLLMGIGPLVAWRRASLRALGKTFIVPLCAAVVTGVALIALGFGSSTPGLLAYTFSAFVLASIVLEFWRGTTARHAIAGESMPRAFTSLIARNRRRYGGYIVHASIVLLAIGIAGSSAYQTVREPAHGLRPGQSMEAAGWTFTYRGRDAAGGRRAGDARDGRRVPRRLAHHDAASGEELVPGGAADVERSVDLPRPAEPRRRVHDRRPDRPEVADAVPEGAREAARESDLGRRLRVRARLADRDVAGRRRAAAPRGPVRARRDVGGAVTAALVLGAVLAVLAVLLVARPFLREPAPVEDRLAEPGELDRRRLELVEERDRALGALKELEFDHRTGKISDDDYRALVGPLRRAAAEALRALEPRAESRHERVESGSGSPS